MSPSPISHPDNHQGLGDNRAPPPPPVRLHRSLQLFQATGICPTCGRHVFTTKVWSEGQGGPLSKEPREGFFPGLGRTMSETGDRGGGVGGEKFLFLGRSFSRSTRICFSQPLFIHFSPWKLNTPLVGWGGEHYSLFTKLAD